MDVVGHRKWGALGHRLVVHVTRLEEEAASRDTIKQAVEAKALLHCSKDDSFPKKQLVAQAMPGKPGTGHWSVWVRVIKRPAEHPWNLERALRKRDLEPVAAFLIKYGLANTSGDAHEQRKVALAEAKKVLGLG